MMNAATPNNKATATDLRLSLSYNQALVIAPEPLRAEIPEAQPYPVDAFGSILGDAVLALKKSIQAPIELCAQSVLSAATLVVQAHFDVRLPYGGVKPLSLFFLTVAASGERKTATDESVLAAARKIEHVAMVAFEKELKAYIRAVGIWDAQEKKLQAKSKKPRSQEGSDCQQNEVHDHGEKPEAPIAPIRFVTDPTAEGLFKLMMISQPSLGLFSDEGGTLFGGFGFSSDNALKTMATFCKFWDGSSIDRVRVGDGASKLYGRRLALHIQAQPIVMSKILSDSIANEQGFLARCLVAWPTSTIGSRTTDFNNSSFDSATKRLYAVFSKLLNAKPNTAEHSKQELQPRALPIAEDGMQFAKNACDRYERLQGKGQRYCELTDRASKAFEMSCRIAGVLAVIDGGLDTTEIGLRHLQNGVKLADWYLDEALRLRSVSAIPQPVSDAETLSQWLDEFPHKQIYLGKLQRHAPNQLRNKERLEAALKVLTENGYIVENPENTLIDDKPRRKSWTVVHSVRNFQSESVAISAAPDPYSGEKSQDSQKSQPIAFEKNNEYPLTEVFGVHADFEDEELF